jgi:hypothetical protein
MVVYLDPTSGLITSDATQRTPLQTISAKRGTDLDLHVVTRTEIPATSTGVFAALAAAGGSPMALASWQPPSQFDRGWLFEISLRGSDLSALLDSGAGSVSLNAEITAVINGKTRKSQTIELIVYGEVYNPEPIASDIVNVRRTNLQGYQEFSFDEGATWWLYSPTFESGVPIWQWTHLGADQ